MTPLERLLAEEWPTGTFGGARGPQAAVQALAPRRVTTAAEAAEHYAALEAALNEPSPRPVRRLRVVPDTTTDQPRKAA